MARLEITVAYTGQTGVIDDIMGTLWEGTTPGGEKVGAVIVGFVAPSGSTEAECAAIERWLGPVVQPVDPEPVVRTATIDMTAEIAALVEAITGRSLGPDKKAALDADPRQRAAIDAAMNALVNRVTAAINNAANGPPAVIGHA